ncbi:hypothetical protein MOQ_000456 [Trypanosoma cruzi marinkellei]|uniref:Uncharacterized protein n=1 Tax=Trypanosoma cruzi marinkellei TaxID=85056 RepID=K2MVP4_TRYCR|nr:hypothetical protein MOQ_000456 [Trypanosoma cruzi marinkellei]
MASGKTSPAPIDADLQAEALNRFNPLVFTFSVQTGNTFCLPKVVEAMTRDPAFAKGFYVLEKRRSTSVSQVTRGRQGDRRSKQADNTKSTAMQFYEDYVRIAVDREIKRREVERARDAEYAALLALYVEEGLTEAEAAEAARKEMEEAAIEGTSSEEGDVRERLYVFLSTYPTNMEEVTELHNCGLSLHAVVSLSSRVALSGSVAAEKPPQASDSSKGKGKGKEKRETRRSELKDRNGQNDEKNRLTLATELQQYLEGAKNPLPYLKNIFIHSYDVPTDAIPNPSINNTTATNATPNVQGETAPLAVYRLKGTEGNVFSAIVDTVVMLEERYIGFCEWKERRVRVDIPSYVPLRYPQAVEPSTTTVEEKGKKRHVASRKKSTVATVVVPSINAETIPIFDAEPKNMRGVVAHRSVYDTILSLGKEAYFDKQTFCTACASQVAATLSMTNPELLDPFLTLSKREERQMLNDKEESSLFVNYIFDVAMLGVDNAHQKLLLGNKKIGSTEPFSPENESLKKTVPSSILSLQPIKLNDVLSSKDDGTADNATLDIREASVSLLSQSFGIEVEEAKKVIEEVTSVGFIYSGRQGAIAHALRKNKLDSWRSVRMNADGCELEVLYRGDGASRTESSVYTFRGSATFADYVSWQNYCVNEGLYYNPPPPDSEEDEPSEEEEEEEEEEMYDVDEDGGGGKTVKVNSSRRKKVQDSAPVDVLQLADAALRRRRTYEDVLKRLFQKDDVVQEAILSGNGAHCIAEETQWMFTDDGSTIEVRRVVGNTPQVHCVVTDPVDLAFGFLTMKELPTEEVPLVITSSVRCFLTIDGVVQFFFEVVADNTRAVEQVVYMKAVESAKLEAKAQYEAVEQTKTSRGSKEKVPLPSLATLEEALISQIAVPKEREQRKPMTNARALFHDGTAAAFSATEKCLHFSTVRNLHRPSLNDIVVDVCVGDNVRSIRVSHIHAITVYADGCVVINAQEIEGYLVSLDLFGNYLTMNKEGAMIYVTAAGKRSIIRTDGQRLSLEPLMVVTTGDRRTDTNVLLRQDGVQVLLGSGGQLEKVIYGTGCFSASSDGGGYTWHFMGFPEIKVHHEAGRLGFTVDRMETIMDVRAQTLQLIHHRGGVEAILDLKTHRLHVCPMPNGNCFTMDCAFGGLVASSEVGDYCVSPFGRCGDVRENVFKEAEVVSREFLERYEETGGNFEETALQRNFNTFDFPLKVRDSAYRPNFELPTLTLSSYMRYAERSIDGVLSPDVQQSKDLIRLLVRMNNCDDDDGVLLFMNPWLSSVLLQRLKSEIDPTFSRFFSGVSFSGGDVQEQILFLQPPHEVAGEERKSVVPMARSVEQFLLMSRWPNAIQAPRDNKVTAVHVLSTRKGTPLMTDNVAELLCSGRLSLSEAKVWSKAMHTIPLVEKAEVAGMISVDRTQRGQPLRDYTVSGSSATRAVYLPHKKRRLARDGKYNYWRSTGILVASELAEATLNEENGNTAADISVFEGNHECSAVTESHASADTAGIIKGKGNFVPFMHSTVEREMPPQEHRFVPTLSVMPSVLSFGRVIRGNRYALPVVFTNTSIVPCRYRVTLPKECKDILRVHYPRHFLAPGLTVMAQVEISGTQPLGAISFSLNVTHEGGLIPVKVEIETVEEEEVMSSALHNSTAVVLGPALINSFVPGTTRRPPPHLLQKEAANEEASDVLETM